MLAVIYYAKSKAQYHVKPRPLFAQITIVGKTEDVETMQLTASLFQDEDEAIWNTKLKKLFEMRESRLRFQNERMMEIQEEMKKQTKVIEAERQQAAMEKKTDNVVALQKD